MLTFEFQVILSGLTRMTEEVADRLYQAGCDDGAAFSTGGVAAVGFSREADTLEQAIRSALADVNKAGFTVARVEPADELIYNKINQELARR